jgi:hypothetical protein
MHDGGALCRPFGGGDPKRYRDVFAFIPVSWPSLQGDLPFWQGARHRLRPCSAIPVRGRMAGLPGWALRTLSDIFADIFETPIGANVTIMHVCKP